MEEFTFLSPAAPFALALTGLVASLIIFLNKPIC